MPSMFPCKARLKLSQQKSGAWVLSFCVCEFRSSCTNFCIVLRLIFSRFAHERNFDQQYIQSIRNARSVPSVAERNFLCDVRGGCMSLCGSRNIHQRQSKPKLTSSRAFRLIVRGEYLILLDSPEALNLSHFFS